LFLTQGGSRPEKAEPPQAETMWAQVMERADRAEAAAKGKAEELQGALAHSRGLEEKLLQARSDVSRGVSPRALTSPSIFGCRASRVSRRAPRKRATLRDIKYTCV